MAFILVFLDSSLHLSLSLSTYLRPPSLPHLPRYFYRRSGTKLYDGSYVEKIDEICKGELKGISEKI